MAEFEKKFKCTGWCDNSTTLYFRFTNVNNGKPVGNCYRKITDQSLKLIKAIEILAFILAALLLISFLLALYNFCLHRKIDNAVV